jgi:hypothetical protein
VVGVVQERRAWASGSSAGSGLGSGYRHTIACFSIMKTIKKTENALKSRLSIKIKKDAQFMFLLKMRFIALVITLAGFSAGNMIHAAPTPPKWESKREQNTRSLTVATTATLNGKTTPVSILFYCDPSPSKGVVHSTLGVDIEFAEIAKLKPFNFEAFEGPDANPGEKMLLTITRSGKPASTFKLVPSGSTPNEGFFMFSFTDKSRDAKSKSKTILTTLGDNAEALKITISDVRDAKLKLEINIPLAEKQAEFVALLSGLK